MNQGKTVLAYVNGYEGYIKRVNKEINAITLMPLNPNYPPKTYKHPGEGKY